MAIRLGPLTSTREIETLTDEWLNENASDVFDREWWFSSSDESHKMIIKKTLSSLQGAYELELRDNTYMYYSPAVWSPTIDSVLDLCRIFHLRKK